jgi:hypothetical protein
VHPVRRSEKLPEALAQLIGDGLSQSQSEKIAVQGLEAHKDRRTYDIIKLQC